MGSFIASRTSCLLQGKQLNVSELLEGDRRAEKEGKLGETSWLGKEETEHADPGWAVDAAGTE